MDIWMIWATESVLDGVEPWLVTAWDGNSVGDNNEGWREQIAAAEKAHGPQNIRITKCYVDFDAVRNAFLPVDVSPKLSLISSGVSQYAPGVRSDRSIMDGGRS